MPAIRALCGAISLLLCSVALAQPAPLTSPSLRDQQARPLHAEALRGRVVLMHFVFTGCSATCPTQVRELAALHDALPPAVREQVRFVSVSLDAHDTPATMAAFARRLGAEREGWRFVSGRAADVDRIAAAMQAFDPAKPRRSLDDHRTSLYLYDAQGAMVQRHAGVPVDRARLQRELVQLALHSPTLARKSTP